MKRLFVIILIAVFLVAPVAMAKEITLIFAWEANVEDDMKGYALFERREGQVYDYTKPIDPDCTIADGKCYVDLVAKTCEFKHIFVAPDGLRTTFYWVVRAKDTGGNWSADSNEVRRMFDLRAMPNPTILAGVYNDETKSIDFTWQQSNVGRVIKWGLFNSSVSQGPYVKVDELKNTGQPAPYSMSWVVPGDGDYYFIVVAFTEEVFSEDSNEACVQVKVHPNKPLNFKVKIRIR